MFKNDPNQFLRAYVIILLLSSTLLQLNYKFIQIIYILQTLISKLYFWTFELKEVSIKLETRDYIKILKAQVF